MALEQLRALGVTRGAIDHRVRVGRLHRMYRGVYLLGHAAAGREARALAAAGYRVLRFTSRTTASEISARLRALLARG